MIKWCGIGPATAPDKISRWGSNADVENTLLV